MNVSLLHHTPLEVLMWGIRTSHASTQRIDTKGDELGNKDLDLLRNIIANQHDSVLEHLIYTFLIKGISRSLLQQIARHRHISLTVQSTRYTLRKMIRNVFENIHTTNGRVFHLCVLPPDLDPIEFQAFINRVYPILEFLFHSGLDNDRAKSLIPECLKTNLVLTTNARELDHIFDLRIRPQAYWEFRRLSKALFGAVHDVHPILWDLLSQRKAYNALMLEEVGE